MNTDRLYGDEIDVIVTQKELLWDSFRENQELRAEIKRLRDQNRYWKRKAARLEEEVQEFLSAPSPHSRRRRAMSTEEWEARRPGC